MNCKSSAQSALKVAIFRLKIEKFFEEGAMPLSRPLPKLHSLGASILAPSALDLGPTRLQILDLPLLARILFATEI